MRMQTLTLRQLVTGFAACLGFACLAPAVSHAQAWIQEKGHASIAVGYQYKYVKYHLFGVNMEGAVFKGYEGGPGNKLAEGDIITNLGSFDFDYSVLDRLALSGGVAYVSSQYKGGAAHPAPDGGPPIIDNGSFHPTFQDGTLKARYVALGRTIVVTPFVGLRFPLHDYVTLAHSAVGRNLRELQVGTNLGMSLNSLLLGAFIQGSYAYTFVEEVADYNLRRQLFAGELGYYVTSKLAVRGFAEHNRTTGGVASIIQASPLEFSAEFTAHGLEHDVITNEWYTHVGAGLNYGLGSYFLFAIGYVTVAGEESHDSSSITAGIGWNFKTPLAD